MRPMGVVMSMLAAIFVQVVFKNNFIYPVSANFVYDIYFGSLLLRLTTF